ncbi:HTH-type transcriptional regulator DmlR [Shewanella oneidensis]|nr:HTH-type transcriptional regulator DmlR [Shewanella oneidensis]
MTEAGQTLYVKACEIDRLASEAERLVQDLTEDYCGRLTFTAPTELGKALLEPLLIPLMAHFPQVRFEFCFEQDIQDVEFGQFDLALRTTLKHSDNLVAKYLGRICHVLVAAPAYLLSADLINLQDLPLYSLLSGGETQWTLEHAAGESLTLGFEPAIISSNYATSHLLALSGQGIACLPYYLVHEDIAQHKLVRLLPEWQSYPHDLYMVYAKQSHYSKKLRQLQQLLLQWCADNPTFIRKS